MSHLPTTHDVIPHLAPSADALLRTALDCNLDVVKIYQRTRIMPIDFMEWAALPEVKAALQYHVDTLDEAVNQALARALPPALKFLARGSNPHKLAHPGPRQGTAPTLLLNTQPSRTPRAASTPTDDIDTTIRNILTTCGIAYDPADDDDDDDAWLDRWLDSDDEYEDENEEDDDEGDPDDLTDEDLSNPATLRALAEQYAPQLLVDEEFIAATQPSDRDVLSVVNPDSKRDEFAPLIKSEIFRSEIAPVCCGPIASPSLDALIPHLSMSSQSDEFTSTFRSEILKSEIALPSPHSAFSSMSSVVKSASDEFAPSTLPISARLRTPPPTARFTQAQLAELFHTSQHNIAQRIATIYRSGELSAAATCTSGYQVALEGSRPVQRLVKNYSLELALAVARRIRTPAATLFLARSPLLAQPAAA